MKNSLNRTVGDIDIVLRNRKEKRLRKSGYWLRNL